MNKECGIVRDLLPLYHDNVCSSESRVLVEEHLIACEECTAELGEIDKEFCAPRDFKAANQAAVDALKQFKSKILRKNVLVGAVSFVCAVALLVGAYYSVFGYEAIAKYHEGMLTINELADDAIGVNYNDGRYAGLFAIEKQVERNGRVQTVFYINYTETFYTRHFQKVTDVVQTQFIFRQALTVEVDDFGTWESVGDYGDGLVTISPNPADLPRITAIYYIEANTRKLSTLSDEEFAKATENAVLLWERTE